MLAFKPSPLREKKEKPPLGGISSSYAFANRKSSVSIDFTTSSSYFGFSPFSPHAFRAPEAKFSARDKLASNAKNTAFASLGNRPRNFLASLFECSIKLTINFKVPESVTRPIASEMFALKRLRNRFIPH